jgi:S-adenosylmethionine:tRNA ribosyltransferase-isomerase
MSSCDVLRHVGIGTFRPVESEDITQHEMHWRMDRGVVRKRLTRFNRAKAGGGVFAKIRDASVRSFGRRGWFAGSLHPYCGKEPAVLSIRLREWRVVDGLVTIFVCEVKLMMVSALIRRSRLLAVYQEAIQKLSPLGMRSTVFLPEARCDRSQPKIHLKIQS